ncbi:MAG: DUF1415 domain-containing protein [Tibeticola sp.]
MSPSPEDAALVIADTRRWIERAVIGLNLCPFAKAVHVKGLIHYAVSFETDWPALLDDVERELLALAAADPTQRDTTLLIAPLADADFMLFTAFVAEAERRLAQRGLEGTLQIAPLHPQFQFAGTTPEDITNATNRAPYPTLHLLREASIDRAVAAYPNAERIYEANMALLERLGPGGWEALDVGARWQPQDPHCD